MTFNDKLSELQLKLHLETREKLKLEKIVTSFRNKECFLNDEILINKKENDSLLLQITELSSEISRMKYQISIIDICRESEKSKINVHLSNLSKHKECYDILFTKEKEKSDLKNEQIKEKEAENDEIEKQKMMKILEKNEQQAIEAAVIEEECNAIERECSVLLKRNKAIMLKLRGKLIETEDIRRKLMNNVDLSNEFQD